MAMVEVGIRIDLVKGLAFFGVEAVNQRIAAGGRVIELRPAGAIMTKIAAEGDEEQVALGGCQFHVVFEDA